jgi:UDP-N-acetylglucosamine 2-epimerase (non-hydrolysing)
MNCFIIGTRAELIKCFPLMQEMTKNKISYYFIHTGQHDLSKLCKKFKIRQPDIILTMPPKSTSKFFGKTGKAIIWNLKLVFKIRKELKKIKNLNYVFYHGDTMTTTSAAIASSKLFNPSKKYKNVHLEAGLRSENLFEPFPEEISRKIADKFSDILLAVSTRAENNLKKEHCKGKIIVVGNTVVDSAKIALKLAKKQKLPKKFAIITVHRHENIKSKERLEKIVEIITSVSIPCYFSLHDNTKNKLKEFNLLKKITSNKNIKLLKNLEYPEFIYLISKCSLILTDGGSIQEESLVFKKPCILLRKSTERQEGLTTGINYLSKLDVEKTKEKIDDYLNLNTLTFENPYGEKVSEKIIKELKMVK